MSLLTRNLAEIVTRKRVGAVRVLIPCRGVACYALFSGARRDMRPWITSSNSAACLKRPKEGVARYALRGPTGQQPSEAPDAVSVTDGLAEVPG